MHVLDKNLSYEEVALIFVRVNSLGTKLRGSDLAMALITSRWRNSLALFEQFQEECEEKWFTLDLGLIVRALVVFTTGQSRFKTAGTIPVRRLEEGWGRAKDGLRFSINFMRANAGVEDESLLSSPLFLISIAYLAQALQYRFSPSEDRELRRWFYIANARGHYSGSSETTLDTDLTAIDVGGQPLNFSNPCGSRLAVSRSNPPMWPEEVSAARCFQPPTSPLRPEVRRIGGRAWRFR